MVSLDTRSSQRPRVLPLLSLKLSVKDPALNGRSSGVSLIINSLFFDAKFNGSASGLHYHQKEMFRENYTPRLLSFSSV